MQQAIDTKTLYTVIADTLPAEGRDFTIDVTAGTDGKQQLVIKPLTAAGRGFVPVLLERLSKPMSDKGVTVAQDGKIEQEVVTINSIRTQIERDAAAAMDAKLKAMRDEKDALAAAADKIRAERMKDKTKPPSVTQDEMAALKKADEIRVALMRMQGTVALVPKMREKVDALAREIAQREEAKGGVAAVDMDAPLTTLFDRQDVVNAITKKESLIRRMAAATYDAEDLRVQAAMAAKRYALPKGPDKAEK